MPYKSRWKIEIPRCSLPTFLLGSSANLPHTPTNPHKMCLADVDQPDVRFLTRATYQLWCQRFALGLQKSGLFKMGDRLLLISPNDIFCASCIPRHFACWWRFYRSKSFIHFARAGLLNARFRSFLVALP